MSILLARARLRGIYAIIAGAIIIVVIPFFQGSILADTGYLSAVTDISNHHDFGPYLDWVAQNQETDVVFHAVQFIAFLLAFTVPLVLAAVLWPAPSRGSWLARITGQVGFGCYALAVLLGLLVSGNYGGLYANASSSVDRASVAANFGSLFALQNILSHIVGGILLAVGLMIAGAQMMRSSQKALPSWLGYFSVLVAALLVITALQFAALPAAAETSLSSFAFFALALWLIALGVYLARLSTLPVGAATVGATSSESSASVATPDTDVGASESSPQSGGQSKLEETSP